MKLAERSSEKKLAVSGQGKRNPLQIKLLVAGDYQLVQDEYTTTNLKDFLLSAYAEQQTTLASVPSFFQNCTKNIELSGQAVQYELCSSTGQEDQKNVRALNYPRSSVVLLVFHYNSNESFANAIKKWCPEIKQLLPKVPVVLVGVKDDCIPVSSSVVVDIEAVKAAAQASGIDLFVECSLSDLDSVNAVFNHALNCVLFSSDETKRLGVKAFLTDLITARSKRNVGNFNRYYLNTFGLKSSALLKKPQKTSDDGTIDFTKLTRDTQQCVARNLDPADWVRVQMTCRKMHNVYNSTGFWNWGFEHLNFLDAHTRHHPDFQRYHFDPKHLVVILSKHKQHFRKIFRWGVDPWQLAILMGLIDSVKAVHGEETTKKLKDENGYGVTHFLILGEHTEQVIGWLKSINFSAKQDPQYLLPTLAVITGNEKLLLKLVELFGYRLTFTDKIRRFSLLHPAIEYGQFPMVPWLIKQGINPVVVSNLGSAPEKANLALLAANKGYWKLCAALRQLGVDPYATPQHQRIAALAAVRHRNRSLAQTLIKLYSIDTQAERYTEGSFFYAAILSGDPETLQFAVNSGWGALSDRFEIKLGVWKPHRSKTIYHVTAEAGLVDLFDTIAQQKPEGVSVSDLDDDGNSVLHYSARHGDPKKFRRLLKSHFTPKDLLAVNKFQETVAHIGAFFGHTEFVYQLYFLCQSYQFDVMAFFSRLDKFKNTLLHHAMNGGAVKLAIWLVRKLHFSTTALEFEQLIPLRVLVEKVIRDPSFFNHFEYVVRAMLQENLMTLDCLTEFPDAKGETIDDVMMESNAKELYEKLCDELDSQIDNSVNTKLV